MTATKTRQSVLAATNYGFLWSESLDDGLGKVADAGVSRAELTLSLPHVDLDASITSTAREVQTAISAHGLTLTSLNPVDLNLISANAGIAGASLEQMLRTIDLAEAVAAPLVVVVPGRYSALNPMEESTALDRFHRCVETLVLRAQARGVGLAFENVPFGFLQTPTALWSQLAPYASEHIGLTVDVANLHFHGADIASELVAVRDHVRLLHISDTTTSTFAHSYFGEGTLDVAGVAEAVQQLQFVGDTVYELATPGMDWRRWRSDVSRLRAFGWR